MTVDPTAVAVNEYIDYLTGAASSPPNLEGLDEQTAEQVRALCDLADLLWESNAAPALEDDPVAAMLGLIPDPHLTLAPAKLKSARTRQRLKVSEVSHRLKLRGWDVQTQQVAAWERRPDPSVSPALVEAIATVLSTDARTLTQPHQDAPVDQTIAKVLTSDRFAAIARRWSQMYRITYTAAESSLRSTMFATARRGEQLTTDQWFEVLEDLMEAKEPDRDR
jgi:transcriptional regulator with XRE-family HTH domain